jgi:hypothetical protein
MLRRNRVLFNLAFLILFLGISATVSLFHTETGYEMDPFCPACHFQVSCLATAVIHFFQLPILSPLELTETLVCSSHIAEVVMDHPSRSPPGI